MRFSALRAAGIGRWGALAIVITIPVGAPFIYIATHVVEPKLIGGLTADIVSLIAAVVAIPSYVAYVVASYILVAAALVAAA